MYFLDVIMIENEISASQKHMDQIIEYAIIIIISHNVDDFQV